MTLDHILINVNNLANAVSDFENLGFNVYYGTRKKNCHHAMIYFQDGSFLELVDQTKFPKLITFLAKKGVLEQFGILFKRFTHYCISNESFLDFAIKPDEIHSFHQQSRNKSKLMKMKRKNHLNKTIRWKLFAFNSLDLPFVMSDYWPNRLPV